MHVQYFKIRLSVSTPHKNHPTPKIHKIKKPKKKPQNPPQTIKNQTNKQTPPTTKKNPKPEHRPWRVLMFPCILSILKECWWLFKTAMHVESCLICCHLKSLCLCLICIVFDYCPGRFFAACHFTELFAFN